LKRDEGHKSTNRRQGNRSLEQEGAYEAAVGHRGNERYWCQGEKIKNINKQVIKVRRNREEGAEEFGVIGPMVGGRSWSGCAGGRRALNKVRGGNSGKDSGEPVVQLEWSE